jgi:surfactin synthase thioesterase subunit
VTRYLPAPRAGAPAAGLPLFCFPFAGGGASAYSGWQRRLGDSVRIAPVQLPGREGRMGEPRFTDLDELTAELDEQLDDALTDRPHLYFGHSMGALVAFSLALRRFQRGRSLPRALILTAYRPPHLRPPRIGDLEATDAELVDVLASLGGIPEVMLRRPDWLTALLPIARDDLTLCATAPHRERRPLPVPLHVFAGMDDPLVAPAEIREWSAHTAAGFEMRTLPGRHFFIREDEGLFLSCLAEVLARYSDVRELIQAA